MTARKKPRARRHGAKGRRFTIGERVRVPFGVKLQPAIVIEDRGNLGHEGERIWRVRLDWPEENIAEPIELELPESMVQAG